MYISLFPLIYKLNIHLLIFFVIVNVKWDINSLLISSLLTYRVWPVPSDSILFHTMIMLRRNILRTFEAKIPKLFKNIQPWPKNKTFFWKNDFKMTLFNQRVKNATSYPGLFHWDDVSEMSLGNEIAKNVK